MKTRIAKRSKLFVLLQAVILALCLVKSTQTLPKADASIFDKVANPIMDWVKADDSSKSVKTLSIVEISEMRARDIKRRLTREHGFGPDEIAKMIDKKELVNALSYEEHRADQKEKDRKKRVTLRRSIIVALLCVIFVMFRPLLVHAWEVLLVNFEVYTDKKRYEFSRIREFKSPKAAFGLLLTCVVNALQFWLSASVLLSWVMRSKYFFPIPNIPIKPAALLAAASGTSGGAGALGNYGLNVGPMVISWLFRFVNGRLELFMGKALAASNKASNKAQRKKNRAAQKEEEKKEAAIAKEERKAARRARRAEKEACTKAEEAAGAGGDAGGSANEQADTDMSSSATNATDTSELNSKKDAPSNPSKPIASEPSLQAGAMDELD